MRTRSFLCGWALVLLTVSFLDVYPAGATSSGELAAEKAFSQKNYAEVVRLLMPNLAHLSRNGLIALGKSQSELKNTTAALKAFSAGMALDAKDVELKSLYGRELIRAGKDKDGMTVLKEVLDASPKYLPAYRILIEHYEKKKNKYELRLIYQDLVEKFGEKPEFVTKLCELTTMDGLFDLSKKYCTLGVSQTPREPENYVYLGLTFKYTQLPDEAERYLKRAADSFSKSNLAQLNYAQFLEDKKSFVQAFKYYGRAVAADAASVPGLIGLGNTGLEIQKLAESLDAFQKACKLDKTTIAAFRKATNTLRLARNEAWKRKFEVGVELCN
jgi:tetratricopeptide (TPR) repeat protein